MKTFLVWCWKNGDNHDAGKPADVVLKIRAKNQGHAEDKADRKFKKENGFTADVIEAEKNGTP